MKDFEKQVKERHSVRKYLNKEIEQDLVEELNRHIKDYNQESGLNIQLILDNSDVFDKFILHYGRIQNAKSYIAMIGNKEDNSADEKVRILWRKNSSRSTRNGIKYMLGSWHI